MKRKKVVSYIDSCEQCPNMRIVSEGSTRKCSILERLLDTSYPIPSDCPLESEQEKD